MSWPVKRNDCHSFFGWSEADENSARRVDDTAVAVGGYGAFGRSGVGSELLAGSGSGLQLMAVGLKTPENLGSILRVSACFAVERVHHIGLPGWSRKLASSADGPAPLGCGKGEGTLVLTAQEVATMTRVAVGCETLVERRQWSHAQFMAFLDAYTSAGAAGDGGPARRLPLVAVETAEGAVPLPSFSFPRDCVIVAGAEGSGIDLRLLRKLQPCYDSVVYIPMPGGHKSLNVAEAVTCAVYEYCRQWPPGGARPEDPRLERSVRQE